MKAAVHQPQYFPYPGFFHKLSLSDVYVIMDDVQYDKRFTNRNRIIWPNGSLWLSVPINKEQKFLPNLDIEINNEVNWREDHLKKIKFAYRKSKFFHLYEPYFEQLYSREWTKLFDLDYETLKQIISWLGLKVEIIRESTLNVNSKSTQRLIDACKAVGADTYVSGMGAVDYMDVGLFEKNNVKVEFQKYVQLPYPQHLSATFIPNLSIIDLLANVGPDAMHLIRAEEKSVPTVS